MKSYSTAGSAGEYLRPQIGPVSTAIAVMRAAHPERHALLELRDTILRRIRSDLDALDRLTMVADALAPEVR